MLKELSNMTMWDIPKEYKNHSIYKNQCDTLLTGNKHMIISMQKKHWRKPTTFFDLKNPKKLRTEREAKGGKLG